MARGHRLASGLLLGVTATIALACGRSGPDGAQRPAAGIYAGTTAQGLPIVLTVATDRRTLALDVRWACARDTVRTMRGRAGRIDADGRFAWRGRHAALVPGGDGDEDRQRLRLTGREVDASTLSGVWRVDRTSYNGESYATEPSCSTGDVAFRVHRRGPAPRPAPRPPAAARLDIALRRAPSALAAGAGHVWVLGHETAARQAVTAVDPQTGRLGARTPVRAGLVRLAAGEGAAWVLDTSAYVLNRVDARTRRVRRAPHPPVPAGDRTPPLAADLAVGAGGVWVLEEFTSHVLRADARTGRIVQSIELPHSRGHTASGCQLGHEEARRVATARDTVWVTSDTDSPCPGSGVPAHRLSRIDARTHRVTRTVPLSRELTALAASGDGVWGVTCGEGTPPPTIATTCPNATLIAIDPRDGRAIGRTPLPSGDITGLAVSAGAVWVSQLLQTEDQTRGRLLRMDRATGRLTTALRLSGAATNVVVAAGRAWVANVAGRTLTRIR
jgi:outer membrane protein assembly factor BamB